MATTGLRIFTAALMYAVAVWAAADDKPKAAESKDPDKAARDDVEKSDKAAAKEKDAAERKERDKDSKAAADRVEDADNADASPEEKAIRKVVRQVEEAFNKHDVEALTSYFSRHGEIIDAGGRISQGSEKIADVFKSVFQQFPDAEMNIEIESVRVLGDSIAIEEGTTRVVHVPGEAEEVARYAVVYTKEGGDWKMISARDLPTEAATDDHLRQLEWLVGDWIDESDESVVMTSYRWSANERYLVGQFHVETEEEGVLDGSVHIGWDPQLKQLRSWVFDSEGGFATGLWARNDDMWIVKLTGVLADGRTSTCTYRMRRLSGDHAEVDSRDRVIGGVLIDDSDPVTIVRRGPSPESLGEE
ncbi:MAG TPA: nuclear transport factor 2 family protein [Planctomycetaceae bacterium]|nr:nuclear transport factor 2 family protein [Planctomycetaceae bacterium]